MGLKGTIRAGVQRVRKAITPSNDEAKMRGTAEALAPKPSTPPAVTTSAKTGSGKELTVYGDTGPKPPNKPPVRSRTEETAGNMVRTAPKAGRAVVAAGAGYGLSQMPKGGKEGASSKRPAAPVGGNNKRTVAPPSKAPVKSKSSSLRDWAKGEQASLQKEINARNTAKSSSKQAPSSSKNVKDSNYIGVMSDNRDYSQNPELKKRLQGTTRKVKGNKDRDPRFW